MKQIGQLLPQVVVVDDEEEKNNQPPESKLQYRGSGSLIRDVSLLMEMPFVALSRDRKNPIIYQSKDGNKKVKISCHSEYYIASIYDWDIILVIAGKIQELLNGGACIPPRKITIPRHELLEALNRQSGGKQHKYLEDSLTRLKTTLIDTTVGKNRGQWGFIDSWDYEEKGNTQDKQIINIALSEWLFSLCCEKGGLLMVDPDYFTVTSGIKKFLYRTARKHAGNNSEGWEFSIETLYAKSGSDGELKEFKRAVKSAVENNDLPNYSIQWIEDGKNSFVKFKSKKLS